MKDSAIAMAKRLLVDSIWKSANLEGLGTTFPKTEEILLNVPTTTTSEEVLFIINMKRAWQFLLNNTDCDNNLALLCKYNKIVGAVLFQNAGAIRTLPVRIGGTTWEPEIPNTGVILDALNAIEQIPDITLRALKYFCYVARTQMFIDGNKRVAQLIANKVLVQNDIGIFQVPIERIGEFKTLLVRYYETADDTALISFMQKYCVLPVAQEVTTSQTEVYIEHITRDYTAEQKEKFLSLLPSCYSFLDVEDIYPAIQLARKEVEV